VLPDIDLPSPIDASEIGESVRDSALPWDTIGTTPFRAGEPLDAAIQSLTFAHTERAKEDPNLRYLMQHIEDDQETRSRTTVSLNIETRRAEREANLDRALALENERRQALSLEAIESLEDLDEDERPDIQLDQAAGIATDLAVLREVGTAPAQTAQNQQ
jgi:carboxyl-terminal processing protease